MEHDQGLYLPYSHLHTTSKTKKKSGVWDPKRKKTAPGPNIPAFRGKEMKGTPRDCRNSKNRVGARLSFSRSLSNY